MPLARSLLPVVLLAAACAQRAAPATHAGMDADGTADIGDDARGDDRGDDRDADQSDERTPDRSDAGLALDAMAPMHTPDASPAISPYCRPCTTSNACSPHGVCLLNNATGERFCGSDCSQGQACPSGALCTALGVAIAQCIPSSGTCADMPPEDAGIAQDATVGFDAAASDANTPPGTDPHLAYALGLMNQARAMAGAPPLMLDPTMTACAYRHAMDVESCAGGSIQNFGACAHRDFLNGDTCGAISENQGAGSGDEDAAFLEVFNGMIAEGPPPPGGDNHYWNIMNPAERSVGIGIYLANGVVWISEEFR